MFRFKQFSVKNDGSAFKVGTDAVLLGATASLPYGSGLKILDAGTGTGIIALMSAQRLWDSGVQDFRITGIDSDAAAAREAGENFAASPWSGHMEALNLSLSELETSLSGPGIYDLIISNPPYFENSLLNPDPKRRTARHAEADGLSWRTLMDFSAKFLVPGGCLAMILPVEASPCAANGLILKRMVEIRSTASKPVSRLIVEYKKPGAEGPVDTTVKEELTVLENGSYSRQYLSLTKDFHLFG